MLACPAAQVLLPPRFEIDHRSVCGAWLCSKSLSPHCLKLSTDLAITLEGREHHRLCPHLVAYPVIFCDVDYAGYLRQLAHERIA